ncbi:MAG: hypothetical protein HC921_09245 [Synechococcaceae cyanobacterium SM2_3_1]|nr:hypothetical protein [Synechococcaceae cyanobacterium SM2_3_1]
MWQYSDKAIERALRAWRCSPFRLAFFQEVRRRGVPIGQIYGVGGVHAQYCQHLLSELQVETELFWLIQVGILRREVDGQGITDSFRLAPLGRYLLEFADREGLQQPPSWRDHLGNALCRWGWGSR